MLTNIFSRKKREKTPYTSSTIGISEYFSLLAVEIRASDSLISSSLPDRYIGYIVDGVSSIEANKLVLEKLLELDSKKGKSLGAGEYPEHHFLYLFDLLADKKRVMDNIRELQENLRQKRE